jgi:hypothetical protein
VTTTTASDQGRLVDLMSGGLSVALTCLGDATVMGLGFVERTQATLATGAERGLSADRVAGEILQAYAVYLRQLTHLPAIALLRMAAVTADMSAARSRPAD